ncbi:hypothetical protein ZWY2020_037821 [Hordeum vulgare]|nr:hypothetical protein ZWY2020_037821 [Hordeum vulgare]
MTHPLHYPMEMELLLPHHAWIPLPVPEALEGMNPLPCCLSSTTSLLLLLMCAHTVPSKEFKAMGGERGAAPSTGRNGRGPLLHFGACVLIRSHQFIRSLATGVLNHC